MWKRVDSGLPQKEDRYFVMVDFERAVISGDRIIRERIPFASNFTFQHGWMGQWPEMVVTHWMEVPVEGL